MTNMGFSEEELTVQVTNLDVIVISAVYLPLSATSNTHQCKSFHKLTAESTSSNKESIDFAKLLLYFATVDLDLVVVSSVKRSTVNYTIRNRLEDVVM